MDDPPESTPPVHVRPHASRGRALHATAALRPGALLLAADPLLLVPARALLASLCAHCFRPASPRACARCRAAFYCDPACQAASWRAVHSAECRALSANLVDEARRQELPAPARALIQALLKEGIAEGLAPLEGHVAKRRGAPGWDAVMVMATGASAYAGRGTGADAVQAAAELLSKIEMNAFQRSTDALGLTGLFLEPTLAMANHSCVPNALVHFDGRKAYVRAARDIQPGDEIEISYTAVTDPLPERRAALAHYMFECRCPRCLGDLNVYQVAAACPSLDLNRSRSLVTDVARLRSHPAVADPAKQSVARRFARTTGVLSASLADVGALLRVSLQEQCRVSAHLVAEDLWAVSPIPETLAGIADYYFKEGDRALSLATACLLATACDPYRFPQPFHSARLHRLLSIAKLLSNTAADTASQNAASIPSAAAGGALDQEARDTLGDIDQVSLCQMLLLMILSWCPEAYHADWEVSAEALEMLRDIDQLGGREQELSLINEWRRNPDGEQSKAFFEYAVVQRIEALARIGRAGLKRDFGV